MPRQRTIRVNQGYVLDSKWEGLALAGRTVRTLAAGWWRFRTETGLLVAAGCVRLVFGRVLGPDAATGATVAVVVSVFALPGARARMLGRLACARSRRRVLACLRETRVATSTGRLPLVLRSRTTRAGERLTLGLFPGQSAELLDARVEELRAAARARDVTVTRDPGRADRVTVDVIRRDPLSGPALPSPLLPYAAVLHGRRADPGSAKPSAPIQEVV